jgi:hypothetical protein
LHKLVELGKKVSNEFPIDGWHYCSLAIWRMTISLFNSRRRRRDRSNPPSSGSRLAVRFLLVDLWLSNFIQTSTRRHTILPAEVPSARRQGAINPPQADKHNEKQLPKTTQRRIPRFL